MYNQILLVGVASALAIATLSQVGAGRRALRHRSLDALRVAVSAWLIVVAAAFAAANTLTTHIPDAPSFAYVTPRNINIVPFRTIVGYIGDLDRLHHIAVRNLLGNLVLFAPAGAALALHPGVHVKRAAGSWLLPRCW